MIRIGEFRSSDNGYRTGYFKALNDLIERMDNGNLEDYVDPYEIGGFMLCLKNAAYELKEEILNDPYRRI